MHAGAAARLIIPYSSRAHLVFATPTRIFRALDKTNTSLPVSPPFELLDAPHIRPTDRPSSVTFKLISLSNMRFLPLLFGWGVGRERKMDGLLRCRRRRHFTQYSREKQKEIVFWVFDPNKIASRTASRE